ncbi:SufBD protein [candidate division WOR-3 bacterium JGI_Cruoil_03_51_56]|uniref:SufBD protein n=1 Tax=candidate division WOR-3 bacterium JGI_Cruoil_03_51_56 TaxID=1973747 RepID=A0A235BTE7_UNCW3|nr:MAG: SufBD protein [candidate division WOR-3 bacterium JGI_Cruoil_03_51_56]
MSNNIDTAKQLLANTETGPGILADPGIAHLIIHGNQVIGRHELPGIEVKAEEQEQGTRVVVTVKESIYISKPVHMCFGLMRPKGIQRINTTINIGKNSRLFILAHCIFPNAVDVRHIMDATINLGDDAECTYLERHIHNPNGGVKVYPTTVTKLGEKSRMKTEFELLRGRVGLIDMNYETDCGKSSTLEMTTRINATGDDIVIIHEGAHLHERATGVLASKVALRDRAKAEVHNKLVASGAYARGHIDCKEIVKDHAIATAIPIVEVNHPLAHITHEAAIGSVDFRQLETLMSRGLSEDEAVELIIQGLLS